MQAGKLGALLLQFPWSFRNTRQNREYLGGLVMQFMEYPLVVEVRHGSWNQPDIYRMLENLELGFCNIDQPQIGSSLPPHREEYHRARVCASPRTQLRALDQTRRVPRTAL